MIYKSAEGREKMKAIVVVDMQEDYVKQYESDLLNRINEHIMQAKENDELTVYIKNIKVLRNGAFTSEFALGLQVLSTTIFYKEKASIFPNRNIITWLKVNEITEWK
jgi:nicotinamidase-related amidase